jgi:2,3-bisphosphoglycerate-dependent phosphoglycerate mutase
MSRTLYLVRHAMTAWNAERRWQGQTDIPLSDEGRSQARALVDRLRGRGLVSVHTSDLSRARETAEIVARGLSLPLASDRDLRERGFGLFEGKTAAECATLGDVWQRYAADRRCLPPGAEPDTEIVARMARAVERVAAALPDDRSAALVVSHGSSIRTLLGYLLDEAFPPLPNGAVYRLTLGPSRRPVCEPIA